MLSHGNGNKVLTAPNGGNASRRFVVELQDKIARVGGGNLDATGFATRNDGIGDLGRSFNYMVQQLRESRYETPAVALQPAGACRGKGRASGDRPDHPHLTIAVRFTNGF